MSRIKKLTNRQEQADIQLINYTNGANEKKRALELLMKNYGIQAVYKCVTKGLSYHHLVDYLAIYLTQIQTWELCYLAVTPDKKPKRGVVSDAQLESSTIKLKRIFELTMPHIHQNQQTS